VSRSAVLRSPGYVTLCSGLLTVFLALSAGAFLDPALADTRDPDWAFWLWAIALSALLLRATFVGLVVGDDRITRRSWLRSKSWPKSEIVGVGRAGYSGLLNRSSREKALGVRPRWMTEGSRRSCGEGPCPGSRRPLVATTGRRQKRTF
jgi:hypothetical protein